MRVIFLYLFWNAVYTIYKFVKTNILFLSFWGRNQSSEAITIENILGGIFFHKYSASWWFMFQLVILELLAPIVWMALQKKISTICFAGLVIVMAILSEFGTFFSIPHVQYYSFIYYFFGAIIARWFPNLLIKCQGKIFFVELYQFVFLK